MIFLSPRYRAGSQQACSPAAWSPTTWWRWPCPRAPAPSRSRRGAKRARVRSCAAPLSHKLLFLPLRLRFDPETFVQTFSIKVLRVKTLSELRMEGKAARGRRAHHSLTVWSPWLPPSIKISSVVMPSSRQKCADPVKRTSTRSSIYPFLSSSPALVEPVAATIERRQSLRQVFNSNVQTLWLWI